MPGAVYVWHVGRIGYKPAFQLQKLLTDKYKLALESTSKTELGFVKDTILIVEHNPVYTIGIRQKDYTDEEESRLKALGAEFFRTDRGGLITFHGPGQLVAYPILNLRDHHCSGLRAYVSTIEETVIRTCEALGIKAERSAHTGVWVNDRKICAIGIHASRYITSHGLALNCNIDLDWFKHIVPCGIEGKGVTSLAKELGRDITCSETLPHFLHAFGSAFNCQIDLYPKSLASNILESLNISDFVQASSSC